MDLGFDGLIVESHCDPDKAWSDAKQQVTPDVLDYILSLLVIRDENTSTEGITQLRKQIDELDNEMILNKRGAQGALSGMDAEFIARVFENIHEESVRQQMEIINK